MFSSGKPKSQIIVQCCCIGPICDLKRLGTDVIHGETTNKKKKKRVAGASVRCERSVIVYSLLSTSTNGIFNDEKGSPIMIDWK